MRLLSVGRVSCCIRPNQDTEVINAVICQTAVTKAASFQLHHVLVQTKYILAIYNLMIFNVQLQNSSLDSCDP